VNVEKMIYVYNEDVYLDDETQTVWKEFNKRALIGMKSEFGCCK